MTTITRRKALATVAAVPAAVALSAVPAQSATEGDDAKLRELWAEYLSVREALEAAEQAHEPVRDAYDAEYKLLAPAICSDDGNLGKLHATLWKKHGMEAVWRPLERLWTKRRKIAKAIRKAKAETLFGVGVKLSVVEGPDDQDIIEGAEDALRAIGELTGFDFVAASYIEGRVA